MEFEHRDVKEEPNLAPGHFRIVLSDEEALELAGFLGPTKGGIEAVNELYSAIQSSLENPDEWGGGIREEPAYQRGEQEFHKYHQYKTGVPW